MDSHPGRLTPENSPTSLETSGKKAIGWVSLAMINLAIIYSVEA